MQESWDYDRSSTVGRRLVNTEPECPRERTKPAMKQAKSHTAQTQLKRRSRRSRGDELDHFVKALSHDMSAHFMLLESSFRQVKESCGSEPIKELAAGLEHVEACLQESKRFLDDLIALGKTGSVRMQPSRVDLKGIVQRVLYEQQELLAERGVRVSVEDKLPNVWCNESRVKQIVTNLLRNAVKHGCASEQPKITISSVPPPDDGQTRQRDLVWIRVHDNGPGISPLKRDEIFLPGRRLRSATTDGSGMGLAIVRKTVDSFGGAVLVDPRCQQGTGLLFSLPAVPHDTGGR